MGQGGKQRGTSNNQPRTPNIQWGAAVRVTKGKRFTAKYAKYANSLREGHQGEVFSMNKQMARFFLTGWTGWGVDGAGGQAKGNIQQPTSNAQHPGGGAAVRATKGKRFTAKYAKYANSLREVHRGRFLPQNTLNTQTVAAVWWWSAKTHRNRENCKIKGQTSLAIHLN